MFDSFDFRVILAMDLNGTIGNGSALPWKHEKPDMERFKKLTTGHTVLMGRKTWDSLPDVYRPLPNRQNIVLTSDVENVKGMSGDNNHVITSMDDLKNHVKPLSTVFLIGGATLYNKYIKEASTIHLTEFMDEFDGDVKLDEETLRYIDMDVPVAIGSSVSFISEHGYNVDFMDLGAIHEPIW